MSKEEIPNTPAITEFLANYLSAFMSTRRTGGLKWTKKRVADYISGSEELSGTISDSTIGRFLDPDCSQKPSDSTVRMIAEFLMLMKMISSADIERADDDPVLRLASAVSTYFTPAAGANIRNFRKSLRGHFSYVRQHPGYVLECIIVLAYNAEADIVFVDETRRLYRVPKALESRIPAERRAPTATWLRVALVKNGAVELTQSKASGLCVIDDRLGVILFQGDAGRLNSVLNISEIIFDDQDAVLGLRVNRNCGWIARDKGQVTLPRMISRDSSADEILSLLSEQMELERTEEPELRRGRRKAVDEYISANEKIRHFTDTYFEEQLRTRTPALTEEKTIEEAVRDQDVVAFKKALDAGGDPNIVCDGDINPLIFQLANDGKLDWIKAALETGRLDLNVRNERGFPPSVIAGILARKNVKVPYMEDIASRYAEICKLLRSEEIRQMLDILTDPQPE